MSTQNLYKFLFYIFMSANMLQLQHSLIVLHWGGVMWDVRYLLANLLCVFVPLFGIDVWRNRGGKLFENASWINPALTVSIVISSVMCTLFNFQISEGATLNLSIVSLTVGFFVLTWRMGLLALGFYIIFEILLSIIKLSKDHLTLQVITTVLSSLPQALFIISIFAAMMCICSIWTKNQPFSLRAAGFVICLLLYTFIDVAYVFRIRNITNFNFMTFAAFVVVLNFTFLIAARLVVAARNAHLKRMEHLRMEKLELISQLAASVAHEIRNPITVVQGFTQLMLKNDYDRIKSHEFLQMMQDELNRAESVISDYLQIAKGPVENTESELNLSLIIDHVVNVLQPYALAKNVVLQCSAPPNIAVYGNHASVTQAIMNLVKNAIEAHESSGTVDIFLLPDENVVEFKITDSGKGIPGSVLAKLGQPYYSTKTKGTGLGLTLVYKVIHDLKGEVKVQSREGEGTTFTVRIPRVKYCK